MHLLTSDTTTSIPRLRDVLNGRVIAPGEPDYDQARTVFVGGIDRHPAVIVKAADTSDVARVVSLADLIRPMRYPEIYPPEEDSLHPTAVTRTMFVDAIDPKVAETILDYLQTSDATMCAAQLRVLGGAMTRVPADATAFAHRASRIMVNLAAAYQSPADRALREACISEFAAALRQGDAGAYVNFLADEGPARVRQAYPGPTWDRLVEVKRRYDSTNLFRRNQNIPPATKPPGQ